MTNHIAFWSSRSLALAAGALAVVPFAASSSSISTNPPVSAIIKRVDPEKYTLKIHGHIVAYQDDIQAEIQFEMDLQNTPLVFPVIPDGGYHTVDMKSLSARLLLDDRAVDSDFQLIPVTGSEMKLGRYVIDKFKGKQVDFHLDETVTCFAAKVDEAAALNVDWSQTWVTDVQSYLQPSIYVESTNQSIADLLSKWTNDKPKAAKPYVLAKILARHVVDFFQVSGKGTSNDKAFIMDGFEINGAVGAVANARGPSHDGICLYVALLRAAGLPARPVIGIDFDEPKKTISWAEFYLPSTGWIAVDFRELYDSPGSMRDLNRPWSGFGTNDDLNQLIPVAHDFHPPIQGLRSEGAKRKPLIWGWLPMPISTPATQQLFIKVAKAPNRGGAG